MVAVTRGPKTAVPTRTIVAPSATELSMGMTGDLELAIAEGATIVRVGTAVFGPRVTATTL